MEFSWNPDKNERNIRERGLDFATAPRLWENPLLIWPDTRVLYGEARQSALGVIDGRVMFVGFVERGNAYHIFSFRKANARETRRYYSAQVDQ